MLRVLLSRVSVGLAILLAASVARAQAEPEIKAGAAPEAILKPWTEAVETYHRARATATVALVRALETAEEKARAAGNLDAVKSLKQERTLLDEKGTLPTSVKTATFEKALDKAETALRAAAKKAKTALVRQRLDEAAAAIDQELASVLQSVPGTTDPTGGKSVSKSRKGSTRAAPVADGRTYWKSGHEKGNEFFRLKPLEWVETTHDGSRVRNALKETARTPEYVQLFDPNRKLAFRLRADVGDVCFSAAESQADGFDAWAPGKWIVDTTSPVYLADLPELAVKVREQENQKTWGWGQGPQFREVLFYLENRPALKGILTYPPPNDFALVTYDISRLRKQVFRAQFGIADLPRANPESPLTFVVLGDGKRLFASEPIQTWGTAHACEVDIRTVKELQLRVECSGGADAAYALWFEPRLSSN